MPATVKFEQNWWSPNTIGYEAAWEYQRELHALRVAEKIPDTVLYLEHDSIYTAGKRTEPHERPTDGSKAIDVDRGGKITYHGPGQLVAYPIVKLPEHVGVVDYVRRLEEAMIRTIGEFAVKSGRIPGRSGTWLAADNRGPERKIGAIGIRVSHNVTMHGLALNTNPDMSYYDRIVACGIADAGVTSLEREIGRVVTPKELSEALTPHLLEMLQWQPYEPSVDVDAPSTQIRVLGVG